MDLNTLSAISPIDGRYRSKVITLPEYFSEYGLIKYRVKVEIEYLLALEQVIPQVKVAHPDILKTQYEQFSIQDAEAVKNFEKTTNHDVKAVEYFIKQKLEEHSMGDISEFVHFGLTSQDINNTAIPLLLKDFVEFEMLPLISDLVEKLEHLARMWQKIPMLARTHGQPASPTTIGKEMKVFENRIAGQVELLNKIPQTAKFGGATGNMNALHTCFPEIDWHQFADSFIEDLGLKRSFPTTQIEPYDNLAALLDNLKRINTILIDLCRDMWQYISLNYFNQKINNDEVGSSTMPHKVNPIDFENAEGNYGLANAIFEYMSGKLPVSRMQRDLTDSTLLRNLGVPIAHSVIAYKSTLNGLEKLELNKDQLDLDLDNHWVVVAEGIQSILRREGYPKPFEALKELTRNHEKITPEKLQAFIEALDISENLKTELKAITPFNYTGKV